MPVFRDDSDSEDEQPTNMAKTQNKPLPQQKNENLHKTDNRNESHKEDTTHRVEVQKNEPKMIPPQPPKNPISPTNIAIQNSGKMK
jgi:hypothetical protein